MIPSIGIWGLCCYTIVTSYPFLNWQLRAAPPIPIIWASNTTANLTSKMGRLPTISHAPPINMKLGLSKVQTTNSKPPGQSDQRIWLINKQQVPLASLHILCKNAGTKPFYSHKLVYYLVAYASSKTCWPHQSSSSGAQYAFHIQVQLCTLVQPHL